MPTNSGIIQCKDVLKTQLTNTLDLDDMQQKKITRETNQLEENGTTSPTQQTVIQLTREDQKSTKLVLPNTKQIRFTHRMSPEDITVLKNNLKPIKGNNIPLTDRQITPADSEDEITPLATSCLVNRPKVINCEGAQQNMQIEQNSQPQKCILNGDPDAIDIYLCHQITIPKNTRISIEMTFDNRLRRYFKQKMSIEPTMPTYRNELCWLIVSRQIVTLDRQTSIEVTNPRNKEITLQVGTFMGTWYQSERYTKAPFTFKNPTAAARAKTLSAKIKQTINKLTDYDTKEEMENLKENIEWLRQLK